MDLIDTKHDDCFSVHFLIDSNSYPNNFVLVGAWRVKHMSLKTANHKLHARWILTLFYKICHKD